MSDLLRQVDELTAEQEGEILATARRNGTDPERIYARWNAQRAPRKE